MTDSKQETVTQADRDVAVDASKAIWRGPLKNVPLMEADCFKGLLAEAFARHRINSTTTELEEARALLQRCQPHFRQGASKIRSDIDAFLTTKQETE